MHYSKATRPVLIKSWFRVPGDDITIFHRRRFFMVAGVRYVEGVSLSGLDRLETLAQSVTWVDPLETVL